MTAAVYVTNTEIKAAMPNPSWDTTYDTLLTTLATRASRMVDRHTGRHPGAYAVSATEVRYYDGNNESCLRVDEMAAAPSAVAVAETGLIDDSTDANGTYTTWASSDYYLMPYNSGDTVTPFYELHVAPYGTKSVWYGFRRGVKITAKFGYATTVPEPIATATIIQAAWLYKRGMQGYENTSAIVELNQLVYSGSIDPTAKMILDEYRRKSI